MFFLFLFSRTRIQPAALLGTKSNKIQTTFCSSWSADIQQWYLLLAIISHINHYIIEPFRYLITAFWCPYHQFSSTFSLTFYHLYGLLVDFSSIYQTNILSVVLLVCLPYLEVFPVLTLFFFHSIAVQLLRRFLSPPNFNIFVWLLDLDPKHTKGWCLGR